MSDLPTVKVQDWTGVVRRARLGRTLKGVALVIATYADHKTGLNVRPGLARITVEAEVTYNVAKSALAKLRAVGLIELVKKATVRGASDEYRLILAEDLLDRIDVLTPSQVTVEAERIRAKRRGKYRAQGDGPDPNHGNLQPTAQAARPVDNPDLQPTKQAADEDSPENLQPTPCTQTDDLQPTASSTCSPRRYPPPSTDLVTTTTDHPDNDLRTAVTGPRATGPSDQDPNSRGGNGGPAAPTLGSSRCGPHGLAAGIRADGQPRCPLCRFEARRDTTPAQDPRGADASLRGIPAARPAPDWQPDPAAAGVIDLADRRARRTA